MLKDVDQCTAFGLVDCGHGSCVDGYLSYTCDCETGWEGGSCDLGQFYGLSLHADNIHCYFYFIGNTILLSEIGHLLLIECGMRNLFSIFTYLVIREG